MKSLAIQLEKSSIGAAELVDFVVSVNLDQEGEVEVVGWFEAKIGRSEIRTNEKFLFRGELRRGETKIPSTLVAPNGPFDYVGHLMNVFWSMKVELRPAQGRNTTESVSISLHPSALMQRSVTPDVSTLTTFEGGMGGVMLNALIIATALAFLVLLVTGFNLAFDQYLGLAAIGGVLGFLGAMSPRAARHLADLLGGGFDVEIEPRVATQGEKVQVTVKSGRQSVVPLNRVEVRLQVLEVAVDIQGDKVEESTHELDSIVEAQSVTGRYVDMTAEFELPGGLPQSIQTRFASVVWGFEVTVELGFAPDWRRFFPISVGLPAAQIVDEADPVAR